MYTRRGGALARRFGSAVARGAVSLVVLGCTAEVAVRALGPTPRAQVVRPGGSVELYVQDGVPMWRDPEPHWRALEAADCADPTARHVSFVGDSILQVTGGPAEANFAYPLRAALGDGWCVHNAAQAGFVGRQKLVRAREQLRRHAPEVLVWEVWGEVGEPRLLGGTSYELSRYEVDAAGYPVLWWLPLPAALHRPLFRSSRAWEYSVLALGPDSRPWGEVQPMLDEILALPRAEGTTLELAYMPELERPFGEPSPVENRVHTALKGWAADQGVPQIDVGESFTGRHDHRALRLDPCCHYNAAGHAALAELFAEWVPTL